MPRASWLERRNRSHRPQAHPASVNPFKTVAPFTGASMATRASVTVTVTSIGTVIVRSGLVAVTFSVPV